MVGFWPAITYWRNTGSASWSSETSRTTAFMANHFTASSFPPFDCTKMARHRSERYHGKLETLIEDLELPNPVIRSYYRDGSIKQYVRDHLLLRTEATSNNVRDFGVPKAIEAAPQLREAIAAVTDRYQSVQQDILETFVDRGQLRQRAEPTQLPNGKRLPGLKLDHPWQLAVMHALVRFAHIAAGDTFIMRDLHPPAAAA